MLEGQRLAADPDLDFVGIDEATKRRKVPTQQFAQLILPREPERILDATESSAHSVVPLNARIPAGPVLARLDRHLADREDVGLELRLVQLEPIA